MTTHTLERMAREAHVNKLAYQELLPHGRIYFNWWRDAERTVRDCIKNPYILESNEMRIRSAFGEELFIEAMNERGPQPS